MCRIILSGPLEGAFELRVNGDRERVLNHTFCVILTLGFVLLTALAVLHSQPMRLGQMTLKELAHDLDLALEEDLPWKLWFASG